MNETIKSYLDTIRPHVEKSHERSVQGSTSRLEEAFELPVNTKHYAVPELLERMSHWYLSAARLGHCDGKSNEGFEFESLGYGYFKASTLINYWYSVVNVSITPRMWVKGLVTGMLLAERHQDQEFATFCEKLLFRHRDVLLDSQVGYGFTCNFVTGLLFRHDTKGIESKLQIHEYHEEVLKHWVKRTASKGLSKILDLHCYSLSGGDLDDRLIKEYWMNGNPLEYYWVLGFRSRLGLSVPRSRHPLLAKNPEAKTPKGGIPKTTCELISRAYQHYVAHDQKLKGIFQCKLPRKKLSVAIR